MFNLVKHWKLIVLVINVMIFTISAFTSAEPLNDAAKEGNLDEVKRLIEEGANIEVRDSSRSTPLYNALDQGNKDVMKFLILKGANVNVNCTEGYTPLHRATRLFGGDKELVNLLIYTSAYGCLL
jgi:ankyrin repeat protein